MDRRRIFASFGALIAAPVMFDRAFAQSGMAMPGLTVGPAEMAYAKQTLAVGSLSLLASRLAATKAAGRKLQEFVKFEIAEQETVADILTGMMKPPSAAMGMVMAPTDDQARANIDQAGTDKLNTLSGLSGTAFDTAYVQAEVDGHQKLLVVQNSYLGSGKNREALDVAKLAKGMITEHLQLLSDIQSRHLG